MPTITKKGFSSIFVVLCIWVFYKKYGILAKNISQMIALDHSEHSAPTITKTGFSSIFACIVYLSIYPKYPILVKNILIIIIHFPYEHYDKWSFRQGCR